MKKLLTILCFIILYTSAKSQTTLNFDGGNDYVAINKSYSSPISMFTAEIWFKTNYNGGGNHVNWAFICFDRSEYWNFSIEGDGRIGFHSTDVNGTIDDFYSSINSNLVNNTWHHAAVVYDGVDKIIYVDGIEVAKRINAHSGGNIGKNGVTRYGFLGDGSEATLFNSSRNNVYYDGMISETRIWSIARTASEIQANYNTALTGNEGNLDLYYNFSEGSGSNLNDLSGNGKDGTIFGATWVTDNAPINTCTSQLDWANLQHPANGSIACGGTFDIYGQVYEPGLTNADPNAAGQGLTVEFGYSNNDSDPSTWTNWSAATYNSDNGNNDEFKGTFSGLSSGTYYYTFRYKSGACDYVYGGYNGGFWDGTNNVNGVLTVALPSVDAGADVAVCDGDPVTLSASGAATYAWDNNITDATAFTPTASATYTVTGTDANGCIATDAVDVTVNALPTVDAGADVAVCDGDPVTLSASGAATYAWDNNITDATAFTPTASATYTVTGTDANGCIATDAVDVTVNALPTVDAGADITICEGGSVTLNGGGADSYIWDNGVNNAIPFVPGSVDDGTNGSITTDGNYTIHTFTSSGTLTIPNDITAEILVVGGGGAGGGGNGSTGAHYSGGGGGAGGILYDPAYSLSAGNYTVTVGDGGLGAAVGNGSNGQNSSISTLSSIGGGGGGKYATSGSDGGSGGGGGRDGGSAGNGTSGQGYNGATSGGGGGGAGEAGNTSASGNGGDGLQYSISGSAVYYAGGGGGSQIYGPWQGNCNANPGGAGGGGAGNSDVTSCPNPSDINGLPNTGGGGGGSGNGLTAGNGGSGIIILKYLSSPSNTTYTVTGTDANGCIATDAVDVTVNALPTVDAGADVAVCDGDPVTLSGSGAATYAWDNNITDATAFTPTATATYTVTGTDANGCIATDAVDVTVNALPTVNAGADVAVCVGNQITLNATDLFISEYAEGSSNNKYIEIFNGTGADVDLSDYELWKIGNGGNWAENIFGLSGTLLAGEVYVIYNNLSDATIVSAGDVTWTQANFNGDDAIGLAKSINGTMTLIDAVGKDGTDPGTGWSVAGVNNATKDHTLVRKSNVTRPNTNWTTSSGTNTTDSEWVVLAKDDWTNIGGHSSVLPITYAWDNNITDATAFTPTATATYTVTGTDANGCIATDAVDVTVNALPTVDAGADVAVCDGDPVTLSASGAATYAWDNAITDGTSFTPTATATYTVTGTDANGCIATDAVDVTVNALPTVDAGADVAVCDGDPVTLSGSGAATYAWDNNITDATAFTPTATATYTVTGTDANGCIATDAVDVTVNALPTVDAGADVAVCDGDPVTLSGSGAATYAWDNNITDATAFTPTATATYTVTGTDANGCIATDAVDVTVNALPTVDAGADVAVCDGDPVTLSASGAATYAWDNAITDGSAFTPTATATYTVTGTDANGCIATDAVDVTVNALPTVDAGADITICVGNSVTLSGSGAATYAWDNNITDATAFTPTATATYTVTGTDANGCIATDAVDVTVNALPTVDAGADVAVCDGDPVTLSGSGAATYAWDNNITDATAFTPTATATYTVTGTDANGCIATDAVDVTVNALPTVDAGADVAVCDGDPVTLSASGAATYAWDNAITDGSAFTPTATATYTVTGTDANGCIATDAVDVTVNALPTVDAGADITICVGNSVTLSGSGAATYAWDNNITDATAFTPTATATYTVTGTDANGCIATDAVDVTVNALPTVDAGADVAVCDGDPVTLSASGAATYAWDNAITDGTSFTPTATATYTVTGTDANGCIATDAVDVTVNALPTVDAGADVAVCDGDPVTLSGSGAATYAWDNNITDATAFTPTATATYTVTGTDANGCIATDAVDVTVNALPTVDAGADVAVCDGNSVTLSGSGAATYAWDNNITDATAFTPTATATYTVTGTDANGCIATDAVDVTVNALPTVDAGADVAVCDGDPVTLSGSGAATYAWDNNITDATAFTPTATATYTVTGTDANGCIATDAVDVTVNALPTVDAGADVAVCDGNSVTLSGSGAATYAWDNNITDATAFTPTATATYTVTGTDANGCIATDAVDVTVNALPTVDAGADITICVGNSVTLSGSGAATYAWDNNITDATAFTPTATATYTVTGTDANGCIATDAVDVTVNALPTVGAGADVAVCDGDPVTLSASGAATYAWDNAITDGSAFTPTTTATYTVTGTDANGCIATDAVDVTVNALYYNVSNVSLCTGDSILAGGVYQTVSGTFYDSLSSISGCDSIIETVLTVSSQITVNLPLSVCYGDSALINGNYELANGNFYDTATSVLGCDSITITNFTVENLITNSVMANVCYGGSLFLGGAYQTVSGAYVDTLTTASGCDSVLTTNLMVDNVITNSITTSVCFGDSLFLGGAYQTVSGAYVDTLTTASGCDSVLTTNLMVDNVITNSITTSVCFGDSLFLGGAYQSAAGNYVDSLSTASGCDSLVTTTLTINSVITNNVTASVCSGDSLFLGGAYQTVSGAYIDTLTTASGCDSVLTTNLMVDNVITNSITTSVCFGDSLFLGGAYQTVSGAYIDTLTTASGCDSVLTTNLMVDNVITNSITTSVCFGDSLFLGGAYQTVSGAYVDTLTTASGCDSVLTTNLMVDNVITNSITTSVCFGDSLFLGGAYQSAAGNYVDSLSTASGCDSLVTTTLTINSVITNNVTASVCSGDSLFLGGAYQSAAGNYVDSLSTASGCDSLVTTTLTISSVITNNVTASVCSGDSLFLGGAYQSAAGNYVDSLSTASGCDSLVTTTLTVNTASSSTDTQLAPCDFTWIDGVTYTASNSTATFTTSNALGCDSVVTLDLTINPIVATIAQNGNDIEASATNGAAPYSFDWSTGESTPSITPAANGPYWVVVSDANACSSDTTSFDVTFVSGTGILSIDNVFNIYPNPTNDLINIDTKGNNQYLSANVYDIFGKLLINTNNSKISLNKFEDGVYILEINTPTNTFTTRIIKH